MYGFKPYLKNYVIGCLLSFRQNKLFRVLRKKTINAYQAECTDLTVLLKGYKIVAYGIHSMLDDRGVLLWQCFVEGL